MNRKQFILLAALMAVVGVAGLVLYKHSRGEYQSSNPSLGRKLLGDFPVNDVARLTLKEGSNELNLVKKNDLWRVGERNDYPANYSEISDFLLKVRDLKIVQSEKAGPSVWPRLGLVEGRATNAALAVEFRDQNDKVIRAMLLGKKHMKKSERPSQFGEMGEEGRPDGRYVKVGKDSENVAVISDALANIEPKPDQWLNKDFFKVEKVRSMAAAFPAATNSWKLARETETAEWKLADAKPGEQLDTSKASSAGNSLSSPSFVDVAANAKPEDLGLDKPTSVTVDTFDHFTYTLNIGHKTNDDYPLTMTVGAELPKERTPGKDEKPADKDKLDKEFKDQQKKLQDKLTQEKGYEKWIYLVSGWSVEPLLKERGQLLVEKKEEPKTNAPPASAEAPRLEPPKTEPLPPANAKADGTPAPEPK